MAQSLTIALAQLNLFVGDIAGNLEKMTNAACTARDELKADIIVFPELSITGYPPEDLLFRQKFLEATAKTIENLAEHTQGIYCLFGHPQNSKLGLQNAASLSYDGKIIANYAKQRLPNYGVFDEHRYFTPGTQACIVDIAGIRAGIIICEDLWHEDIIKQYQQAGTEIILCLNASPFELEKDKQRRKILSKHARLANTPIVYVNCVGGQDELVFDGGSMVLDKQGNICSHAGFFNEYLHTVDFKSDKQEIVPSHLSTQLPTELEVTYMALVTGVKDYVEKNHIPGVVIGLSGGIDSALTLAIAVDALGADRVRVVLMPSRYTAQISLDDAITMSQLVGVDYETISIEPIFRCFLEELKKDFPENTQGLAEQNIQARCRGTILMAIANKTGCIVLTTGNRSELAVGYCTLYGDMAGGFGVLKDVPKTLVYELASYRNILSAIIPERIITREPSAELAENQLDQDSLPPYDVLDQLIDQYINKEKSLEEIVAEGFDENTAKQVINLINRNEFKRRQAPIGTRINHLAFGRDRRYPITCK